ncbi:hypothetical protein QTP88_007072 [Uroleucon formosanum]
MSSCKSGYSFKCIIKSCGETKTQKQSVSFFSFPKNPTRCEIWLKNCQLPADTLLQKNIKLCGKHFEKKNVSKLFGEQIKKMGPVKKLESVPVQLKMCLVAQIFH